MKHERLRLEEICFDAQGENVLDGFNLTLFQGEILGVFSRHALVKNQLIAVISGHVGVSSGRVYLNNEASPFDTDDSPQKRQIGLVSAAKTLVDDLNLAENIFVIRQGFKAQVIDQRLLYAQTEQLMTEFGLSLAPSTLAYRLSEKERCCLEIVKIIALGGVLVILQDLSSFLSDVEIDEVLAFVASLKARGMSFLLVDSSARHLSTYADRVLVVKNGKNFWTFRRGELNDQAMRLCFARESLVEPSQTDPEIALSAAQAPIVLAFEQVSANHLSELSFSLRGGEALCLFDEAGAGIDAIKALLCGERTAKSGRVKINEALFSAKNAWEALDQGLAMIVENPAEALLFPDFSALENLYFPAGKKVPGLWANSFYADSCQREYAPYFKPGTLQKYPNELSAQELHTLVYCRWHLYKPSVVVCVKPFHSVDKKLDEISRFFIELLCKKGCAVLILANNALEGELTCKKIVINQKNAPLHPKNAL